MSEIKIIVLLLMVFYAKTNQKMDDETKKRLTFDHSPEEKESLLKQVAENEAKNAYNYTISVGSAYYEIENVIMKGSGRSGKGVRQ